MNSKVSAETPLFIGRIIENELRRQERSVTWLSRKIHCDRRNVYDIFRRADIDTNLLYRISVALNTDFFKFYSMSLQPSGLQFRESVAGLCTSDTVAESDSRLYMIL